MSASMPGRVRSPNVTRVRNAYENLREASEVLTMHGFVAVRTADLRVVLDLLLDHRPNLGDPNKPDIGGAR